ncbi:LysR family transcriptional regulator [Emcibacter sp.]|uniref:LysR family transcriptional regulator n=1 Tax=Emcibacter sp. TaxID=1979954 RepID=UPI002AA85C02|nr:LysR family transcriptional regulator [Emcibacter sp.]
MRFRQIEVFHAVMTSGTVTKAAKNLRVSQPSVTSSLQQTEQEIGFPLFDRTGGRLTPTAEARILFEEVNRAHDSLVAIERLCGRLKEGAAGHIRVAATPAISQRLLPIAITRFQKQHKRFTFDISSEHSPVILSNLDERPMSYHMGFTFGQDDLDGIGSIKIADLPVYCAVPAKWVSRMPVKPKDNEPIDLELLRDFPCVELYENEPLGQRARSLFLSAGVSPQNVVRVHDHHMAASLVHNEIGFAILDALAIHNLVRSEQNPGIVTFPLRGKPVLPVTSVFSQKRSLSYPMRYFVDCVVSAIKEVA